MMHIRNHFWAIIVFAVLAISADSVEPSQLPVEYESVEKLLIGNKIDARIYGLGGYQEECVQLELHNPQSDTVNVRIEAGRRLVTVDSSMQNILLVREDTLRLAPGQSVKHSVYGFCCNANRHSPVADAKFEVGKMANAQLRKLALYLASKKLPTSVMQSAIWSISNNHSTAGIGTTNDPKVVELRNFVARLKNEVAPWYDVVFKKDSTLCSGEIEKIICHFAYQVNTNGFVTLAVVDKNNMPRKILLNSVAHNPDTYQRDIVLDVADWPRGKYFMRLSIDGVRKIDKVIEL